jgi:hypothetical protein
VFECGFFILEIWYCEGRCLILEIWYCGFRPEFRLVRLNVCVLNVVLLNLKSGIVRVGVLYFKSGMVKVDA